MKIKTRKAEKQVPFKVLAFLLFPSMIRFLAILLLFKGRPDIAEASHETKGCGDEQKDGAQGFTEQQGEDTDIEREGHKLP